MQLAHLTKGSHQHDVVSQLVGGYGTSSQRDGDGASVVAMMAAVVSGAGVVTAVATAMLSMGERRALTERIMIVGRFFDEYRCNYHGYLQ